MCWNEVEERKLSKIELIEQTQDTITKIKELRRYSEATFGIQRRRSRLLKSLTIKG